jgi:multidrug transporter EmrE-like cation transporter
MLSLFVKIIYIILLTISSTLFIYYIKLYSEKNKKSDLFLCILNVFLTLFMCYKLFQNKEVPLILMALFTKVIPLILLTILDTYIFKTKMTLMKVLGIIIIIIGIIIVELKQ